MFVKGREETARRGPAPGTAPVRSEPREGLVQQALGARICAEEELFPSQTRIWKDSVTCNAWDKGAGGPNIKQEAILVRRVGGRARSTSKEGRPRRRPGWRWAGRELRALAPSGTPPPPGCACGDTALGQEGLLPKTHGLDESSQGTQGLSRTLEFGVPFPPPKGLQMPVPSVSSVLTLPPGGGMEDGAHDQKGTNARHFNWPFPSSSWPSES